MKKINFVFAISVVYSTLTAILSDINIWIPEWTLICTQIDFWEIIYFSGISSSKWFLHVTLIFLTQQHWYLT